MASARCCLSADESFVEETLAMALDAFFFVFAAFFALAADSTFFAVAAADFLVSFCVATARLGAEALRETMVVSL